MWIHQFRTLSPLTCLIKNRMKWSYLVMSLPPQECLWFLKPHACDPDIFTNKSNTKALCCESCICPANCIFSRQRTILISLCQNTWIKLHQSLSTKCNTTSQLSQLDGMLYSAKQSHEEFWKMLCWRQLGGKLWVNETHAPNCCQIPACFCSPQ